MKINHFFLWLRERNVWVKLLFIFAILYIFLLGVNCLGASFKSFGEGFANKLMEGGLDGDNINPWFAALASLSVGLLVTSLIQSSSATTSMVVGLVASGALNMEYAVPMVMGANLGTTVTNTLVSLGHITRPDEFRRAFSIATVHDFFNTLTIIILLPIEICTHFLQNTAEWFTANLTLGVGMKFESPVRLATKAVVGPFENFLGEGYLNLGSTLTSLILLAVAMLCIFFALYFLTKTLRMLMQSKVEVVLNRVLARGGYLGILIGCVVTASVQSSSITTSLLVPLVGAALITVQQAFPITLGANLGTTITAIIASSATEKGGLTIALVHLMFNVLGILIFYPIPFMRRIPLKMAESCADFVTRRRYLAIVFIVIVFYVIPGLFILIYEIVIH